MKCFIFALLLLVAVSNGQRRRRPRVHKGHVVGPVGFNLPDLTKLPSTQFECIDNKRYFMNIHFQYSSKAWIGERVYVFRYLSCYTSVHYRSHGRFAKCP